LRFAWPGCGCLPLGLPPHPAYGPGRGWRG